MTTARSPDDLPDLFVRCVNAADLDGVVALYDVDAALELPTGEVARGHPAIRAFYASLIADRPTLTPGEALPAIVHGDLALTSTRLPVGVTSEVAQRGPDGTWRWIIDRPLARPA
jgi:ketosteroid isomerase-like protein